MKNIRLSRNFRGVMATLGVLLLAGCGSTSSQYPPIIPNNPFNPIPGGGVALPGGCVPIYPNQMVNIGFNGINILVNSTYIRGGSIPGVGQFGQMGVGAGGAGGPYQRSSGDGFISMNLQQLNQPVPTQPLPGQFPGTYPGTYPTYPNTLPTAWNAQGMVQVSSGTALDILYKFGGYNPLNTGFPGTYPTVPGYPTYPGQIPQPGVYPQQQVTCVSGIALDLKHNDTLIYDGWVYLYMNGTSHGYRLYF